MCRLANPKERQEIALWYYELMNLKICKSNIHMLLSQKKYLYEKLFWEQCFRDPVDLTNDVKAVKIFFFWIGGKVKHYIYALFEIGTKMRYP